MTVEEFRSFYAAECDGELVDVTTPDGTKQYDLWCPCFDANGSNTGVDIAELAVFSGATGGQAADEAPATEAPATETEATTTPAELCADSDTWYKKNKPNQGCSWVGKNAAKTTKRCKKKGQDGIRASEACPAACGLCPVAEPDAEAAPSLTTGGGQQQQQQGMGGAGAQQQQMTGKGGKRGKGGQPGGRGGGRGGRSLTLRGRSVSA